MKSRIAQAVGVGVVALLLLIAVWCLGMTSFADFPGYCLEYGVAADELLITGQPEGVRILELALWVIGVLSALLAVVVWKNWFGSGYNWPLSAVVIAFFAAALVPQINCWVNGLFTKWLFMLIN